MTTMMPDTCTLNTRISKKEFIKSFKCDWSCANACWEKVLNVC